jgi:PIN domain nuclease of toxin-antitoxin system
VGGWPLSSVLLDTHVWAWSLISPRSLSPHAVRAINSAPSVCVSTISLFEIAQKVRLGKWDEMAPFADRLADLANEQEINLISVSSSISILAAQLDWAHRDPFDRIICATALVGELTLLSADKVLESLTSGPARIW